MTKHYELTDHLCRKCGQGRILKTVYSEPKTVTLGGNPIYLCSMCEAQCCSMMTYPLCWCGVQFDRGGIMYDTMCAKSEPSEALKKEGWHIKSQNYKFFVLWKPSVKYTN